MKTNKIIPILVSIILLLNAGMPPLRTYSGNADFAGGKGTADSPFLIKTAEQLSAVSKYSLEKYFFKLENDIDLTGFKWTGIKSFTGMFDGGGYTISNIPFCLFQYNGGTVRKLAITGKTLYSPFAYENSRDGVIEDCYSDASVTGDVINAASLYGRC